MDQVFRHCLAARQAEEEAEVSGSVPVAVNFAHARQISKRDCNHQVVIGGFSRCVHPSLQEN